MTTFYLSDTRFGHNKDFLYKARGFDNIEDHDAWLTQRWYNEITNASTVNIVGDLMMGPNKLARAHEFFRIMPYKQINWYLGNHDPILPKIAEHPAATLVTDENDHLAEVYFVFRNPDKQVRIIDFRKQNSPVNLFSWKGTIGHLPFKGSEHKNSEGGIDPREARYPFPDESGSVRVHGHTHLKEKKSVSKTGILQVHVGVDAWMDRFCTDWDIDFMIMDHFIGDAVVVWNSDYEKDEELHADMSTLTQEVWEHDN